MGVRVRPRHRVVGSAKDENNVVNGTVVKRVGGKILQPVDIISVVGLTNVSYAKINKPNDSIGFGNYLSNWATLENYTEFTTTTDDIANIGKFKLTPLPNEFWVIFAKGSTLEQARTQLVGLSLSYQLAQPKTFLSQRFY